MRLFRIAGAAIIAGLAAGCVDASHLVTTSAIGAPAAAPVAVDAREAAQQVSAIRAGARLGPVTVSPTLNAIAARQAEAMALAGVVSHDVDGGFVQRLRGGGYVYQAAAENLGAGYRTLEEAIAAWLASPAHRENLLARGVTEIGIASAFNPASPYRTFWALVLAAPR